MKKLILTPLLIATTFSAVADEKVYMPTEKEKAVVQLLIKDEADAFFDKRKTFFNYGDYIFTSPEELQKEYNANEIRADKKFKNKNIVISGTIASIQSGIDDKPFLTFKTNQLFQSPQATFVDTEIDKVIELNKEQEISLVCLGNGEITGTPLLKNCVFKQSAIEKKVKPVLNAYKKLLEGKADPENKDLHTMVLYVSLLKAASNDFYQCKQDKITADCIEKSIDAKKLNSIKNDKASKEKFKLLANYLHINLEK